MDLVSLLWNEKDSCLLKLHGHLNLILCLVIILNRITEIEKKNSIYVQIQSMISHIFVMWIQLNLWAFSFPMLKMTNDRSACVCACESRFLMMNMHIYMRGFSAVTLAHRRIKHLARVSLWVCFTLHFILLSSSSSSSSSSHTWQFNSARLNGKFK